MSDYLIDTQEINNHRISIYYDVNAECPATNWDLCGRYLFEYSDRWYHRLHSDCNWKDWFYDSNHSLEDALRYMVTEFVKQEDIVKYYKSGKVDGLRFVYNRSSRLWELQTKCKRCGEDKWDTDFEIEPSELKFKDYRSELVEFLEQEELVALIRDCAKDVVIQEWSSCGYSQGDYLYGIAYVTKERYDKYCGRTDVDWRQGALECIDEEIKEIGMWAWGDVKGYVLEKKVSYTKKFKDESREDEECFDWEEVDSCWGYFMETQELIENVISEHNLKEIA